MTFAEGALLVAAAAGAGALNAIAGGGSFLSFPALVLTGVPAIAANATSTVALWPGSVASTLGYRKELQQEWVSFRALSFVSLGGGIAGALLLLLTPERVFAAMVPFLLLAASLVFTFGERVRSKTARSKPVVLASWLAIAIYGGYFGGGMGLLMLAALTLKGHADIHRMNALKSALGTLVNGAAVAIFAVAGVVQWVPGGLMIAGSMTGGFAGAALARKVDAKKVKPVVIALGWALTAAFFYRTFVRS